MNKDEMMKLIEPPTPFKDNAPKLMVQEDEIDFAINNYNEKIGHKNEIDDIQCDKCKNKGLIAFKDYDDFYGVYELNYKPCECFRKRQLVNIAIKNGFEHLIKVSSKDYKKEYDWQKENYEKLVKYCMVENDTNKWFIAIGQIGSGKTLIASIVANNILKNTNREIFYINWLSFINNLKRNIANDNITEVNDYLEHLKKVDVLFLDDVLKNYVQTDLKYIYEIINYRYVNDKKTIFTSEYIVDELLNIDQATFSRAIEKASGYIIDNDKDRKRNIRLNGLDIK